MQRMGMVIGLSAERVADYKRLHQAVWPQVLEKISQCHIRNYTIFLREPENLLFSYWEYHGLDFSQDAAEMAAHGATRQWWALCGPCQTPLPTRAPGEWWAAMEPVFHID